MKKIELVFCLFPSNDTLCSTLFFERVELPQEKLLRREHALEELRSYSTYDSVKFERGYLVEQVVKFLKDLPSQEVKYDDQSKKEFLRRIDIPENVSVFYSIPSERAEFSFLLNLTGYVGPQALSYVLLVLSRKILHQRV